MTKISSKRRINNFRNAYRFRSNYCCALYTNVYINFASDKQVFFRMIVEIIINNWTRSSKISLKLICGTLTNHDMLPEPSSKFVLSFTYTASFYVFCGVFLQVSKTIQLPKVQQSGRHCRFTKISEGIAHAQSIICS